MLGKDFLIMSFQNNNASGNGSASGFTTGRGYADLKKYLHFDSDAFFTNLELTVTGMKPWLDYETKQPLGYRVDTVITADSDDHAPKADGEVVSNLYRPLTLKCKAPSKPNINIGDKVRPVAPICKIWGPYLNQLSITCDDVVVTPPANGKKD